MNRFFKSPKFLVAAALATAALAGVSVAEARPDVYVSIGLQGFPTYVEPAPVYLQRQPTYVPPRPIYVQPAATYVRPPVFVAPREVFERPRWAGDDRRDEWERERAWRRDEWSRRQWREQSDDRYHDRHDRKWHHDHRD
jgi:hypothetical protein